MPTIAQFYQMYYMHLSSPDFQKDHSFLTLKPFVLKEQLLFFYMKWLELLYISDVAAWVLTPAVTPVVGDLHVRTNLTAKNVHRHLFFHVSSV